jgi:hypothetical protein
MADIKKFPDTTLTPDSIRNRLFTDHAIAHDFHLAATTLSQHLMLKELYEALEDHKDVICEFLLGIQSPKRFNKMSIGDTPLFSDQSLVKFLEEGCEFSKRLCTYGKEVGYEELTNLASNLQGSWVKAKYLNTLK